jgi:hypothetical protein
MARLHVHVCGMCLISRALLWQERKMEFTLRRTILSGTSVMCNDLVSRFEDEDCVISCLLLCLLVLSINPMGGRMAKSTQPCILAQEQLVCI